jgi:BirA family biotin operon repressor/biotin-[acetyl-CoA-carboxylase] ligase
MIWPIGWTVHHVAETGSTNDDLVAAASAGAPDCTVIVADFQTAGKGRLDRTWDATRGSNLLVSLLFRYESEDPSRFTRIVALAARDACESLSKTTVQVKWPNDLIVGGRKLGGLLAVASPRERFVVVGIGVNVGWAPPDAVSLAGASQTGATRVVAGERMTPPTPPAPPPPPTLTPHVLLAAMLERVDTRRQCDDAQLRAEHKSVLATLGVRVRIDLRAGESLVGDAIDLDDASRLIVQDDEGVRHVIDVGDVVHLRAQ